MRLKTILNRVQKFKSFVYENVKWSESDGERVLLVKVVARAHSDPISSGCKRLGPGYDKL